MLKRILVLTPLLALLAAAACTSEPTGPAGLAPGAEDDDGSDGDDPGTGEDVDNDGIPDDEDPDVEEPPTALDDRVLDYNEALRTASIKLNNVLPTLDQIVKVRDAGDQAAAYEEEIDRMLADPRFRERMIKFWKDTMRQGGGVRNSAPIFAARVMEQGLPYTELFTATSNTCPDYDYDAGAFVDGDCDNGVPMHAGVLTNPGVQMQFYGNMAFRRARWVQETFTCAKFPAELDGEPVKKGEFDYLNPWAFESIGDSPINFQDYEAVVCANCHGTMNHQAPLFANFDMDGNYQGSIQVMTPTAPDPITTTMDHWLKPGETTAWRYGVATPDLPAFGEAMAADPIVAECAVARMWNFAMSKEDIVTDLATIPYEVIEDFAVEFEQNNYDLKAVLRTMMLSDDFVRF